MSKYFGLGLQQRLYLLEIVKHPYHDDCGWTWFNRARNEAIIDSLQYRGFVARDRLTLDGKPVDVFRATSLGIEVASRLRKTMNEMERRRAAA